VNLQAVVKMQQILVQFLPLLYREIFLRGRNFPTPNFFCEVVIACLTKI